MQLVGFKANNADAKCFFCAHKWDGCDIYALLDYSINLQRCNSPRHLLFTTALLHSEGVSTGTDLYNLQWLAAKIFPNTHQSHKTRVSVFSDTVRVSWIPDQIRRRAWCQGYYGKTVSCFHWKDESQDGWWFHFVLHQRLHRLRDAKSGRADVTMLQSIVPIVYYESVKPGSGLRCNLWRRGYHCDADATGTGNKMRSSLQSLTCLSANGSVGICLWITPLFRDLKAACHTPVCVSKCGPCVSMWARHLHPFLVSAPEFSFGECYHGDKWTLWYDAHSCHGEVSS